MFGLFTDAASCILKMHTRDSFPRVKHLSLRLTTHLNLVLRLRICGALTHSSIRLYGVILFLRYYCSWNILIYLITTYLIICWILIVQSNKWKELNALVAVNYFVNRESNPGSSLTSFTNDTILDINMHYFSLLQVGFLLHVSLASLCMWSLEIPRILEPRYNRLFK
jgi:hypothetical protein